MRHPTAKCCSNEQLSIRLWRCRRRRCSGRQRPPAAPAPATPTLPARHRAQSRASQFRPGRRNAPPGRGGVTSPSLSSQVEAGVYEGVRELWECAIDLVGVIANRRASVRCNWAAGVACPASVPGEAPNKWSSATTTPTCWSATLLIAATSRSASLYGDTGAGCPRCWWLRDVRPDPERRAAYREDDAFSVECIATLS